MTNEPKQRPDPGAPVGASGPGWNVEFDEDLAVEAEFDNGDLRYVEEEGDQGELPEEDDDNPFQDSDEALPDDDEEKVLQRNPSKEGGLFDEPDGATGRKTTCDR